MVLNLFDEHFDRIAAKEIKSAARKLGDCGKSPVRKMCGPHWLPRFQTRAAYGQQRWKPEQPQKESQYPHRVDSGKDRCP